VKFYRAQQFWSGASADGTTLASRGRVAKTPLLRRTFACLAVIMGETGDSGYSPSLDGMAFCRGVKNDLLGSVGKGA
jgi:hypothetical protein